MDSGTLNCFFAKTLLDSNGNDAQEKFLEDLLQSAREGHLCMQVQNPPDMPENILEEGKDLFPKSPVVRFQDLYYLQKNWVYETHLIHQLERLKKGSISPIYSQDAFKAALAEEKTLSQEQRNIVATMFSENFSILCGGPGTGKTYTAGVFVQLLLQSMDWDQKETYHIVLAAPTGKAALHLEKSLLSWGPLPQNVSCKAQTLHHLLKLYPGSVQLFSDQRIDADLVIVDEASMMDVSVFAHLLEKVQGDTRLILMGDPNQLPPIEAGSLFADLAKLFGSFLQKCVRTENQQLHNAAEAILQGNMEQLLSCTPLQERFDESLIDSIYQKLGPFISEKPILPQDIFHHLKKFRCLNALRRGPYGVDAINKKILEKLEENCLEGMWWAVPMISTVNVPHQNIYNGSIGVLIGQRKGPFSLKDSTAYYSSAVDIPYKTAPTYEISFVLSIHKSQGSEFEEILVLLPEGSENFGKEALYTAVTRAKKTWQVIADPKTIEKLIKGKVHRNSGISKRILSLPKSSFIE